MKFGLPASTLFVVLALVLATAATAALLVVPFYTGVRATAVAVPGQTAPPVPVVATRTATLVEVNGPGVLVVLAIPIALPVLALAAGKSRFRRATHVVGALLLVGFCLLTGFSVGLFYVPTALAMVVAAALAFR